MDNPLSPDVIVTVCRNCLPEDAMPPRQWHQEGVHVLIRLMPCSGKTNISYLFKALEGGALGHCVVTCPKGECRHSQGNYRAELRVRTLRRLLGEIGVNPECMQIIECPKGLAIEEVVKRIREKVAHIVSLQDDIEAKEGKWQETAGSRSERTSAALSRE